MELVGFFALFGLVSSLGLYVFFVQGRDISSTKKKVISMEERVKKLEGSRTAFGADMESDNIAEKTEEVVPVPEKEAPHRPSSFNLGLVVFVLLAVVSLVGMVYYLQTRHERALANKPVKSPQIAESFNCRTDCQVNVSGERALWRNMGAGPVIRGAECAGSDARCSGCYPFCPEFRVPPDPSCGCQDTPPSF